MNVAYIVMMHCKVFKLWGVPPSGARRRVKEEVQKETLEAKTAWVEFESKILLRISVKSEHTDMKHFFSINATPNKSIHQFRIIEKLLPILQSLESSGFFQYQSCLYIMTTLQTGTADR